MAAPLISAPATSVSSVGHSSSSGRAGACWLGEPARAKASSVRAVGAWHGHRRHLRRGDDALVVLEPLLLPPPHARLTTHAVVVHVRIGDALVDDFVVARRERRGAMASGREVAATIVVVRGASLGLYLFLISLFLISF